MDELNMMQKDMTGISNQINLISKKLIRLYSEIDMEINKSDSVDYVFILKDFKQILNSILFLDYSCAVSVQSVGMDFIPYWNFQKNIFIELNVLLNKLYELMEEFYSIKIRNLDGLKEIVYENEKIKNNIKLRNKIIKITDNHYLRETKELRNKIEHGIDPFFTGEFLKIKDNFKIDKIFNAVKNLYEIFMIIFNDDKSKDRITKKNNFKKIEVYKIEHKDLLKDILENLNDTNIDLRIYIELYGKYVNQINCSTNITENELSSIVYDMTFKYMSLNKMLSFSLGTLKLDKIKVNGDFKQIYYCQDKIVYEYFTKVSLSIIYSLYEKIGMFLINAFRLEVPNTYFKAVIKYVCDNDIISNDDFIESLIILRKSQEYKILNIARQAYIHGMEEFKYDNYIEHMSNLLIKNMEKVQQVVKYINEYFINIIDSKMNIKLTEKDMENIRSKIRMKRIEINNF